MKRTTPSNAAVKMGNWHPANRPDVITGLLTWWERKYPLRHAEGNRNTSVWILAKALNTFGVSREEILATCLRFTDHSTPDHTFPEEEIRSMVDRAIADSVHGAKQWNNSWPRYQKPQPPQLTKGQEQAVAERVAKLLADRWQVVEVPPAAVPAMPPPMEVPPPQPRAGEPRPTELRAEVRNLLDKYPAAAHLAEVLALDLSRAKVRPLRRGQDNE